MSRILVRCYRRGGHITLSLLTEDAPQRNFHESARIVRLCAHVEDGDNGADEDEKETAIYAGRNADIDGKAIASHISVRTECTKQLLYPT